MNSGWDIQKLMNAMHDIRSDIGRLKGRVGSMDTMIIGIGVLLGINCIATMVLAIAVWSANGG